MNNKRTKIYAFDRKYEMVEIMKKAKQTPGVATYNIDKYDEKYVKPPR